MKLQSRYSGRQRALAAALMLTAAITSFGFPAAAEETYVITDGEAVIVHTTDKKDPAAVLDEAGVELSGQDTYMAQRNGNHFDLTVRRQYLVRIYADGRLLHLITHGESVGEVLENAGIEVGRGDLVSEPLDAATGSGMVIRVTRVTTETVTSEQVRPAGERVFLNTVLKPGEETVLEEGADGVSTVTEKITYHDGVEAGREVVSETVVTPSRDRVVIRGAETAGLPTDAEGSAIVTAGGEVLEYSRVIDGKATAYNCPGYVGRTASGTVAEVGKVAVDPKVIPLGSRLYIVSQDGLYVYGYCIAEDTGGLIKGSRVDLYFDSWDECIQFGYRPVTIYVVA